MRSLLHLAAVTILVLLGWAAPAEAARKQPTLPRLDLELRHDDLGLKPEPQQRRRGGGYVARLQEDPWSSALAEEPPSLLGLGIPQLPDEAQRSAQAEQFPLMRLLDGEIFPILRIRVQPPL